MVMLVFLVLFQVAERKGRHPESLLGKSTEALIKDVDWTKIWTAEQWHYFVFFFMYDCSTVPLVLFATFLCIHTYQDLFLSSTVKILTFLSSVPPWRLNIFPIT